MTLDELVGECHAREQCDVSCPFERECGLFEDIYGHLPFEFKNLSERQKNAIITRIKEDLEKR